MARPGGFEPLTLCSGGTRSIHLSYGRAGCVAKVFANASGKLTVRFYSASCAVAKSIAIHPNEGKSARHRVTFARIPQARRFGHARDVARLPQTIAKLSGRSGSVEGAGRDGEETREIDQTRAAPGTDAAAGSGKMVNRRNRLAPC